MNMLEFGGHRYLDGQTSDPRKLGWMCGAPPPADKRITFEGDSFFDFPEIRWSLSHMRELGATVNVWRGQGGPSPLERNDRTADIDVLTFVDRHGRARQFNEALLDTYADGIVVLHCGRIVYERYFGALEPHVPHACQSITKSYAGTIAAAFAHEGVLDDSKMIPTYLPELHGTAFEDATLRQVMDMQTGVAFDEDCNDGHSGMRAYHSAAGRRPRPVGYDGPQTLCEYLGTLKKEGPHGEVFAYKSINTEVLAWVMARVTGRSFAQLLQERLWGPLGCEEDGYIGVDSAGMARASGSLSASLRDLARFGELIRREGDWNGKQLIPSSVVFDVQKGDHPAKLRTGYSYRSMWWVTHDEFSAIEARGIHGQRLYIAPDAEMVVARFASHPIASAVASDVITMPQISALGRMLRA